MSSLGPDGTFVDEPAARSLDGTTDVSAAPLWAAFRDRYTRARERRGSADPSDELGSAEPPARMAPSQTAGIELLCCV